jgi:pimeloyl-ACP methyl ester carboxylesterase
LTSEGLFSGVFSRGDAAAAVADEAWLRAVLDDDASAALHHGATSQDVLDTAAMLVTKRALSPFLDDAAVAAASAAALAARHRDTAMIGRTLLQQGLPTTFGLKAAPDGYVASCGALERMDLRPLLADVRAPTLVIGGEYDLAAPPDNHAWPIADGIPGARFELVPAAHLANVEQPDVVAHLIIRHLEGS